MRNVIHTNCNNHNTFGSRLRAYRESKGIKVYDISRKLIENDKRRNNQIIDKSLLDSFRRTYSKWERDISFPDIIQVDILCNVLDCDFDFLMCKIDTPRKCVHDVKQVIGLSDESISILADTFKKTKQSYWLQNCGNIPEGTLEGHKNLAYINTLSHKERLSIIDFIIKNNENNDFLSYMQMYLFSDFIIENEYNSVELMDKHNGYTVHLNPNFLKESLLSRITFQLQKWKEEIEKSNH